jgi:hypothetical protein
METQAQDLRTRQRVDALSIRVLMLFRSLCGFLAENIREHQVKRKEQSPRQNLLKKYWRID